MLILAVAFVGIAVLYCIVYRRQWTDQTYVDEPEPDNHSNGDDGTG